MNNWKRKFFILWSGQAVSVLTSSVLQMALIWYLTAETGSALVLSIASIAGFLPTALLGTIAGTLVDRMDRKATIISADMFIAAVSLIIAICSSMGNLPIWLVMAVLALRSVGTAFHTPAISAVTPLIVPESELTKCSGYTQSLQTIGYIAGTAVAGVLFPVWSISQMVALDVAGAVTASAATAFVKIPKLVRKEKTKRKSLFGETKEGFSIMRKDKGLFALLWTGAAFMVLFSPVNAIFPLMCMDYFGGTTRHASIAEIAFAIGMLIGGGILGKWGGFKNRAVSIISAMALMGGSIALSGLLPKNSFAIFAVLCIFMGLSSPFYSGPQMALMQERIAPEYLGRIFGLYGSVMSLAMPIGLAISGPLADQTGVHTWFLICGAGCLLVTAVTWLIPSIRNLDKN